jgi:hypothetical protein
VLPALQIRPISPSVLAGVGPATFSPLSSPLGAGVCIVSCYIPHCCSGYPNPAVWCLALQQVTMKPSASASEIGHVAGYTGHVSGYAHVSGRTFGKATKRAMHRTAAHLMLGDSIPSSPQANPKVACVDKQPGHIPGYAGHVPDYINKCVLLSLL